MRKPRTNYYKILQIKVPKGQFSRVEADNITRYMLGEKGVIPGSNLWGRIKDRVDLFTCPIIVIERRQVMEFKGVCTEPKDICEGIRKSLEDVLDSLKGVIHKLTEVVNEAEKTNYKT